MSVPWEKYIFHQHLGCDTHRWVDSTSLNNPLLNVSQILRGLTLREHVYSKGMLGISQGGGHTI